MNINSQIGKKLKHYRKKRNMTLEEASKQMGVSHQTLFKYEQGDTKISSEALYKLSKIYTVPIEHFFSQVDDDSVRIQHITDQDLKRPLTIMLVEDDVTDAEILVECIKDVNEKVGIHVFNAPDLAEKYLRNPPSRLPDLILLDINLPNQNGFQFLRYLKSSKNFFHIPVIIWTGSLNYADLKKAYASGACAYMCKSYEMSELVESTRKLIDFWQDVVVLKDE
ncbi:MAG: response regulator [Alphaproteobacteria bacterium]|jgi:CheY-like chemotaxis protein/DNA-binding XRE family transcriptional regulator